MTFDIIISEGNIADGSGGEAFRGDIGITVDRITAMGDLSAAEAAERIDAAGLVVAPGFIDIHTHSDFTLLVDRAAESHVHQGVTLEVVGQCGFSCAPVGDPEIMKGTIMGYHEGVDINWDTFDEYLSRLEEEPLGVNVMACVGHGAIRRVVMGKDVRQPSDEELNTMVRILDETLSAGACGLSTGLEYWPGMGATPEELLLLCREVERHGGLYTTHVRNRDRYYDLGFSEALATARISGVKLQISHIQPKFGAPEHAMEHTLEMVEWSREVGADVTFDVIPHDWSHTPMTASLPAWALKGDTDSLIGRLNDRDERERMKDNPKPIWQLVKERRWGDIVLFRSERNSQYVGMTMEAIGEDRGCDPFDAAFDILLEEGRDLHNVMWTSQGFTEADIDLCLTQPHCMVISDTMALAPYGPLKDTIGSLKGYGWIARIFQHYVRERSVLSLEEAVRRLTSLPASQLKLKDRGILRKGAMADITIFDRDTITDHSSIEKPTVYPTGIEFVTINGKLVMNRGERLPINAGQVIRAQ